MAADRQNLNELFQDVGAGSHAPVPRTLKGATLLPLCVAIFAEEASTVFTLHWYVWNFKTNAANHGVSKFPVHLPIDNSGEIMPALIESLIPIFLLLQVLYYIIMALALIRILLLFMTLVASIYYTLRIMVLKIGRINRWWCTGPIGLIVPSVDVCVIIMVRPA